MNDKELRDFQEFIKTKHPLHIDIVTQLLESYESNNSLPNGEASNVGKHEQLKEVCKHDFLWGEVKISAYSCCKCGKIKFLQTD